MGVYTLSPVAAATYERLHLEDLQLCAKAPAVRLAHLFLRSHEDAGVDVNFLTDPDGIAPQAEGNLLLEAFVWWALQDSNL